MTPAGHQSAAAVVLDRIHHISFAVVDLDEVVDRMERILGVAVTERGCVPGRQAEVAIFKLANASLEFVAPATSDSPLNQYLAECGEGFFSHWIRCQRRGFGLCPDEIQRDRCGK